LACRRLSTTLAIVSGYVQFDLFAGPPASLAESTPLNEPSNVARPTPDVHPQFICVTSASHQVSDLALMEAAHAATPLHNVQSSPPTAHFNLLLPQHQLAPLVRPLLASRIEHPDP